MPLERGPFVKIPDSALPYDTQTFDNQTWVNDTLADVWVNLDDIISALVVLDLVDTSDFAPDMDDGLVDVLISQGADWVTVLETAGDAIDGAAIISDSYFADALNAAPEGTWSADPPLFVPPGGLDLPAPSGGTGIPAPGQTGIHLSVTPPDGYTFTLTNTTAFGANAFTVGDTWVVSLTGPAGAAVSVTSEQNGVALPSNTVGAVANDGTFTLTSAMGPTEVGAWVEEWFVGKQLVAIADFSVLPSSS